MCAKISAARISWGPNLWSCIVKAMHESYGMAMATATVMLKHPGMLEAGCSGRQLCTSMLWEVELMALTGFNALREEEEGSRQQNPVEKDRAIIGLSTKS